MRQSRGNTELTIVAAETVRRYADGDLPADMRKLVEATLLDDARARRLVIERAIKTRANALSRRAAGHLERCVNACAAASKAYSGLYQSADVLTVRQAAAARARSRDALLTDMRRHFRAEFMEQACSGRAPPEKDGKTPPAATLLNRAETLDEELMRALMNAFEASIEPVWKARIARWIAYLKTDSCDIMWLDVVFSGLGKSGA